ncbi:MAG: FecR family protein [Devosia sp.]
MQKLIFGLAVCTFFALTQGLAMAASGRALGVDPNAEAKRKAETHLLTVGSDIFIGDRVVTGATGQVQIKFDDKTELVVGPSSSLVIEDYLLRADGSVGKLALNALAGTFRFVTGGAPKDRYTIKTPTATIGVRGTAFELYVSKAWTYILMQHGSVIGSNKAGKRMVLEAACEVGQISLGDAIVVGHADDVSGADRKALRGMFKYAADQRSLLREFRISGAERCLRRPAPGGQGDEPASDSDSPAPTPTPDPDYGLKYRS